MLKKTIKEIVGRTGVRPDQALRAALYLKEGKPLGIVSEGPFKPVRTGRNAWVWKIKGPWGEMNLSR